MSVSIHYVQHGLILGWTPIFRRGCYLRRFSNSTLFLAEREVGSRWRLGRTGAVLLFHGMKGKYLLVNLVFVNFPRK